jgi:hypothetical protein
MNREKIKELLIEYGTYIKYSKHFQANGSTNSVHNKFDEINEALASLEQEEDGWIQMNKGKLINDKKYIFYKLFEDYPGEERSLIAYWDEYENCANTLPNNQDGNRYAVTHYMGLPSSPKERHNFEGIQIIEKATGMKIEEVIK